MISNWGGILPEAQREFEKFPEWGQFLDGLLQVAELQGSGAAPDSGQGTLEPGTDAGMDSSQLTDVPAAKVEAPGPILPTALGCRSVSGSGREPVHPLNLEFIDQWISREGYTNKELAEKLHCSVRTISSMRNNESYHGRRTVQKLAALMNCHETDLYRS